VIQATQNGAPRVVDHDFSPADAEALVAEALRLAQQAADVTLAEAQAEADAIRSRAHQEAGAAPSTTTMPLAALEAEADRARADADDIRADAEAEAEEILSEARARAAEIRDKAKSKADKIRAKALAEADEVRSAAQAEAKQLDGVVESMRRELVALSEQLAAIGPRQTVVGPDGSSLQGIEVVIASMRAISAEMAGSFSPWQTAAPRPPRPLVDTFTPQVAVSADATTPVEIAASAAPVAPVENAPPLDDRRLSPIPMDAILPMVGIVLVLIVVLAWLG
jgi:F0F1-type ATP synthase membrane subunit b/b'